MNPWLLGLLSGGSSLLGGLLNRQRDPMQDFLRTQFLTLGANNPLDFANSAYQKWLGSPAYTGIQNALYGQQTGFQQQLQSSLANRGLLNSGVGNIIGSLGSNLFGGNLANIQGQQWQGFADLFPQLLNQRMGLAGLGRTPSVGQAFGAGLQGLGNFGLNYLSLMQQPQAQMGLPMGAGSTYGNNPIGPIMGQMPRPPYIPTPYRGRGPM